MSDTIEIYCRDSSHEERRWVIDVYGRTDDGYWVSQRPAELTGKPSRQVLEDNQYRPGSALHPARVQRMTGEVRVRHKLRCTLCGLTKVVRDDRFQVALTALAAAGHSDVSLAALAATM